MPTFSPSGVRQLPDPVNEPIRNYAPGSSERAELQARLKAMEGERADIPVVIGGKEIRTGETAFLFLQHFIKMLKAGARGYVLKDAEPKELQKALNTIFEEGFYHSELVTGKMHKQVKVEEKVTELSFTAKEEQFLSHCCSELTYKDIAELMNVSPRTVDGYRDILFAKLDVKTRTGLVLYAIKSGIVNIA